MTNYINSEGYLSKQWKYNCSSVPHVKPYVIGCFILLCWCYDAPMKYCRDRINWKEQLLKNVTNYYYYEEDK